MRIKNKYIICFTIIISLLYLNNYSCRASDSIFDILNSDPDPASRPPSPASEYGNAADPHFSDDNQNVQPPSRNFTLSNQYEDQDEVIYKDSSDEEEEEYSEDSDANTGSAAESSSLEEENRFKRTKKNHSPKRDEDIKPRAKEESKDFALKKQWETQFNNFPLNRVKRVIRRNSLPSEREYEDYREEYANSNPSPNSRYENYNLYHAENPERLLSIEEEPITVLSLDGGGIRGLVVALMLEKLEKVTRTPVAELFDMFAGTSIGGILSLFMTEPDPANMRPDGSIPPKYTASEAVKIFESRADEIFNRPWWHFFKTLGGLWGPKYAHASLEKLLQEKFGPDGAFKNRLKDTLITAYELERNKPFFFESWNEDTNNFRTRDVGRATSAAPTFFAPAQFKDLDNNIVYSCIDGGLVANNPAMAAYTAAKERYGIYRKIIVVSIGTGESIDNVSYNSSVNWGPLGWVQLVIKITMSGVTQVVHNQMNVHTHTSELEYLRLQTVLRNEENSMDNYSSANLKNLRHRAEETIASKRDDIARIGHIILAAKGKLMPKAKR